MSTRASAMTADKIEVVRQILLAPPERPNHCVAADHGCSREWVRRVRYGSSCADLFPELPRLADRRQHSCVQCVHWVATRCRHGEVRRNGLCGLGHREATEIGPRFGVGCGAFMAAGD